MTTSEGLRQHAVAVRASDHCIFIPSELLDRAASELEALQKENAELHNKVRVLQASYDDAYTGWKSYAERYEEADAANSQNCHTIAKLTQQVAELRAQVEALKKKLESPSCLYAGPGRGDCEHFVGLPGNIIEGQHDGPPTKDVYGKPNGWCWHCWWSYRTHKAENEARQLQRDKERLDWLEKHEFIPRSAIDAAMQQEEK